MPLQNVQEAPTPIFSYVPVSVMVSFPYKSLLWLLFTSKMPNCCNTRTEAATPGADGCCLEGSWCPSCTDCQEVSRANVTLLVYLAWYSTSAALAFSFFTSPLSCYHPTSLPCNPSAVPTPKPLEVNWMELLAECSPVLCLSFVVLWMLWQLNSPFVSTQSMPQGQSCLPPWRLGMFQAHCIATEHLSWWDEQSFMFHCSLYYVLITGRAPRTQLTSL